PRAGPSSTRCATGSACSPSTRADVVNGEGRRCRPVTSARRSGCRPPGSRSAPAASAAAVPPRSGGTRPMPSAQARDRSPAFCRPPRAGGRRRPIDCGRSAPGPGMLFSSTLFLFLFLPVVLVGQALLHERWRNVWLLLASLVFYAWGEPVVVVVMLLAIVVNWALGLWTERRRTSLWPLLSALAFNLGLLVFFKYADFLTQACSNLLNRIGLRSGPLPLLGTLCPPDSLLHRVLFTPSGSIRLPIGISFFTFQALSYVIDIRRGEVRAQRNPLIFGTYKSLFPQLIAGPIVRYRDVQDQLVGRRVTVEGFARGISRFVTGLGKKMLIANAAAEIADAAFALPP